MLAAFLSSTLLPLVLGSTEAAGETCPSGGVRREAVHEREREIWCERRDGKRHGPARRWVDRTLVSEIHYRDGVEHGPWLKWTTAGQLETRGNKSFGKEQGVWESWHPNGRPQSRGPLVSGEAQGRFTFWNEDGAVESQGELHKGKKVGQWMESEADVIGRGGYVNDKREGRWLFFIEKEQTASGTFRAGKKHGPWTFFLGGKISARGIYGHGKKQGRWTFFDERGRRTAVVHCRNGVPHGSFVQWEEERRAVALQGRYIDDSMHGRWIQSNGDGTFSQAVYVHGTLKHGSGVDIDSGAGMERDGATARGLCEEKLDTYGVLE